jgi:hypothetical protein
MNVATGSNVLNGGQVIVDYLIRENVPYVFGLCGHGNISFIDALYERSDEVTSISVHHESVAGFMADVYYRVSGQPTATFTSCGPGSANLPICLGNAFLDSVPFLAVTGNIPTSQFNRGAFQELYRHYQADFPSTVKAYCKRVFQPTRGDMVPVAIRQAWKTMVTGRPGPVVLDVPFDIFKEAATAEPVLPEDWNANISCRCGADLGPDVYYRTLAVTAMAGLAGNFLGGWLTRRVALARLMAIALVVLAAGVAALPHLSSLQAVMTWAAAMGLGGGIVMVLFFSVWPAVFGRRELGRIQGAAQALTVLGSAVGPLLLAWCVDATGSYAAMFHILAAVISVIAVAAATVSLPAPAGDAEPAAHRAG